MYLVLDSKGLQGKLDQNDRNVVMYSSIQNFKAKIRKGNMGIKYVIKGTEEYTVQGEKFNLSKGEYLLTNQHCEGEVLIDSKSVADGICIDIDPQILNEVLASRLNSDTYVPDLSISDYFSSENFIIKNYNSKDSFLGERLEILNSILQKDIYSDYKFDQEFFYTLSENIVSDSIPHIKQLQSIKCVKSSTRNDLINRLSKGKNFIEQYYHLDIDIEKVAQESNMSQYHFFRLFKNVYCESPYQYLKSLRLNKAKLLIQHHSMPIHDVALSVGYKDIFSFSKAYKQFFGFAPSKTLNL